MQLWVGMGEGSLGRVCLAGFVANREMAAVSIVGIDQPNQRPLSGPVSNFTLHKSQQLILLLAVWSTYSNCPLRRISYIVSPLLGPYTQTDCKSKTKQIRVMETAIIELSEPRSSHRADR